MLDGMSRSRRAAASIRASAKPTATSMVVVLTYWLSFEYVRDPRKALEPESAQAAAAARCAPCAEPAGAVPGAGPAHAPADAGGRLRAVK
jgi:hypothetical protein